MTTEIHRQVAAARNGDHPRLVAKMKSGWVVMGETQVLPGYCLLLPDPVASDLNDLKGEHRKQFLKDMVELGDAILELTDAVRINYEMLGNLEPALHAHLFPRYNDEVDNLRTKPIWFYDWEKAPKFDLTKDQQFIEKLRNLIS